MAAGGRARPARRRAGRRPAGGCAVMAQAGARGCTEGHDAHHGRIATGLDVGRGGCDRGVVELPSSRRDDRTSRLADHVMRARAALALLALTTACRAAPIPADQRYPAGTPFRAQYRTIDGTRLRIIDSGNGTPVVLIHGIGASLYAWRYALPPLVAAGYRVVAFDHRGFGFSGNLERGSRRSLDGRSDRRDRRSRFPASRATRRPEPISTMRRFPIRTSDAPCEGCCASSGSTVSRAGAWQACRPRP